MPLARFNASRAVTSKPSPLPPNKDTLLLIQFFKEEKNRDILFSNALELRQVEMTEEHRDMIRNLDKQELENNQEENKTKNNSSSTNTDSCSSQRSNAKILEVLVAGMQFPGCTVEVTNIVLAEVISNTNTTHHEGRSVEDESKMYPQYQFTIIDSKQEARGLRLLVWLFNKIVGGYKPVTVSKTHVKSHPGDQGLVSFSSSTQITVQMKLSSKLVMLLPMSLEKFEYDGSKKLIKLLERDMQKDLDKFRNAYVTYLEYHKTKQ